MLNVIHFRNGIFFSIQPMGIPNLLLNLSHVLKIVMLKIDC